MTIILTRDEKLKSFIQSYFANIDHQIEPMAGDASFRRYYRVYAGGNSFVVMDSPPDYEKVENFVEISYLLQCKNFSAPLIMHSDLKNGFLVLEDFGKTTLKEYINNEILDSNSKHDIYCLIIDLLIKLHTHQSPKFLMKLDNTVLCEELDVFTNWYIPYAYKKQLSSNELQEFVNLWQNALEQQAPMSEVIVLGDYHLENMMYIKRRESIKKIGLLDFQDALSGSPIYDLVSVLEDARLEVSREEALRLIDYFTKKTGYQKEDILLNYHILGAQRNLRILGVFAKKFVRDKNDTYLQYIPRVQRYLEYDLSHPILHDIQKWLNNL